MKRQKHQKNTKNVFKKHPKKWIAFVVILVVATGIFIYNKVSFNIARNNAKEEVTKLIDEIEAESESEVVFKEVRDEGCGTGLRGWLSSRTSCSVKGYLYFKEDGKLSTKINDLDQVLHKKGFLSKPEIDPIISDSTRSNLLSVKYDYGSLYYDNSTDEALAFLYYRYFKDSPEGASELGSYAMKEGISIKQDDNNIFGFDIYREYSTSYGLSLFLD